MYYFCISFFTLNNMKLSIIFESGMLYSRIIIVLQFRDNYIRRIDHFDLALGLYSCTVLYEEHAHRGADPARRATFVLNRFARIFLKMTNKTPFGK